MGQLNCSCIHIKVLLHRTNYVGFSQPASGNFWTRLGVVGRSGNVSSAASPVDVDVLSLREGLRAFL